jgi:hypothetical protein
VTGKVFQALPIQTDTTVALIVILHICYVFVLSSILITMDMITWLKVFMGKTTWLKIFFMNTIQLFNNIQFETLKIMN